MYKPVIFMFSGQGSQYYQMGRELFNHNSEFRKWMKTLDDVVIELTGSSIVNIIYDDKKRKSDSFDQTRHTHPAIFMVEYALAQTLIKNGIEPGYTLGASLGEFAALAVSGCLDYETALQAVIKQAAVLEDNCADGTMMAIVHKQNIMEYEHSLFQNVTIASDNYDGHFVVSGTKEHINELSVYLKSNSIIFQILPVTQGFHSKLIEPAESFYIEYLNKTNIKLSSGNIPFISCKEGEIVLSPNKTRLWDFVRQPIEFRKTIEGLKQEGCIYVDAGPSGTLATFVKYNLNNDSKSEIYGTMTPFGRDLENFERLKNSNLKINKKTNYKVRSDKMVNYALMFPGQGSQSKGMGKDLFPLFPELTEKASDILGYDIKELCLNDPENKLNLTLYTQPSIYVVNALSYYKMEADGQFEGTPGFTLGHSLGEYNALLAAKVFDFITGLKIVKRRAELMSEASGGSMAAVIGASPEQIDEILKEKDINGVDLANYNTPIQIVISGPNDELEQAIGAINDLGIRVIPLKVSAPFHSRYMEKASESFYDFISNIVFNFPEIPVIANVTARPYLPNKIGLYLTKQIYNSVLWTDSVRYLMGKDPDLQFVEVNSKILTRMVDDIKKNSTPIIVEEEPEVEEKVVESDEDTHQKGEETTVDPLDIPSTEYNGIPNTEYDDDQDDNGPEPADDSESEVESTPQVSEVKVLPEITPQMLGSREFRNRYGLEYAYLAGAMYRGVGSKEIVAAMGKAGMMAFLGTGGLSLDEIEGSIQWIQENLSGNQPYGMNLLHNVENPGLEEKTVELYLKYNIRHVEASAYMQMPPAIVWYRLSGLKREDGKVVCQNKIMGKCSRPEVAEKFLSPAPEKIVKLLLEQDKITAEQAEMAKEVPVAHELCVEADSGGHTDMAIPTVVLPGMQSLRKRIEEKYNYDEPLLMGLAGGIGTPQAALSAFIMGADFIMTGSINQCTIESGNSDAVKDMLQNMNIQDTDYAPAGDMFELGAKVQVLRKGVFFPTRANKLYQLYTQYNSLEEIPEKTREQIQSKYFQRSFDEIWEETTKYLESREMFKDLKKAEENPKHKMALIFKWYFGYSTRLALSGDMENKVDYQIHTGPALGSFNQWVKGTELESWHNRHVDKIGKKLMIETAKLLENAIKVHFI